MRRLLKKMLLIAAMVIMVAYVKNQGTSTAQQDDLAIASSVNAPVSPPNVLLVIFDDLGVLKDYNSWMLTDNGQQT